MKPFEHKKIDQEGAQTLDVISEAKRFNYWMYNTIKPYCKGKVLEIGSGIGNISKFLLADQFPTVLTDIRTVYCDQLQLKFDHFPNLLSVEVMDLIDPDFETKFQNYLHSFDTVFALNVVEHIFDDDLAIKNANRLLKKNGHLIILVPAFQTLYNGFDKALEHYRRYTAQSLSTIFTKNNFKVIHTQYFNAAGILGWYVSGKLQKNETIPQNQMKLFNTLVPIFKLVDKAIFHSVGLSVIAVGRKEEN